MSQGHVVAKKGSLVLPLPQAPYVQQSYVASLAQTIQDWQLEKTFCVDGIWMSLEEFVNYVYPEDCAEKTFLILKLKGGKDEN